jgi:ABC-2 type transport system ATP-binding protein
MRLGLFKSKLNEVHALKNINLNIEEGQIFGLLGPNGAGKTTLIKTLTTLLIPTSGTAFVNGYDVQRQEKHVRASIGTMLMGERGLYWKLTGRENLDFFGRLYSLPNGKRAARIIDLIDLLDLSDYADRPVEGYSSGQRMRFAFAKAMLNDAPVIFLDEPTIAMDVHGARKLRKIVKELPNEGKTVVYTSHVMSEIQELCDELAIIDHGEIIVCDTVRGITSKSDSKRILEVEGVISEQLVDEIQEIASVNCATVTVNNGRSSLRLEVSDLQNALQNVTIALVNGNAIIDTIKPQEPSLEDVFIELTGRSLSEDTSKVGN